MTVKKKCSVCGKRFQFTGKPSLCAKREVCSAACGRAIGRDLARRKSKLPYEFDVLYDLYWNQGMSTNEIGKHYGLASSNRSKAGSNVHTRMRALGVPLRKKGVHPERTSCIIEGCGAPIYKVFHKQHGYYGRRCLEHWVAHRQKLAADYWQRIVKWRRRDYGFSSLIESAVPKQLPYGIRDEVCQELALELLIGTVRHADIPTAARTLIKKFFKEYQDKFGNLSLDAPIGEYGVTLGEMLDDRGRVDRAA